MIQSSTSSSGYPELRFPTVAAGLPHGGDQAGMDLPREASVPPIDRRLQEKPALAYAVLLADAAERRDDASDIADLWSLVAQEALALIDADGVMVVEYRSHSWFPLATRLADGTQSNQVPARLDAAAQRGVLTDPGERTDLECPGGWRSLMVTALDRRPSRAITRLLWFADRPDAFPGRLDLAQLLSRHAGAAARGITTRESLKLAVAARQRVGQAIGI